MATSYGEPVGAVVGGAGAGASMAVALGDVGGVTSITMTFVTTAAPCAPAGASGAATDATPAASGVGRVSGNKEEPEEDATTGAGISRAHILLHSTTAADVTGVADGAGPPTREPLERMSRR